MFVIFQTIMDDIKEVRKQSIENELNKINLKLRYDSKLCYCYVNGETGPEWTPERVANECAIMHWLYNFTDYPGICQYADIHESRRIFFHSKKQFKDHMRRYIYPNIKESMIMKNGGIPTTWPWMKNETSADKNEPSNES